MDICDTLTQNVLDIDGEDTEKNIFLVVSHSYDWQDRSGLIEKVPPFSEVFYVNGLKQILRVPNNSIHFVDHCQFK
jgi:hypothetical protein